MNSMAAADLSQGTLIGEMNVPEESKLFGLPAVDSTAARSASLSAATLCRSLSLLAQSVEQDSTPSALP